MSINAEAQLISSLNATLVQKAIEDSTFRAQLLTDPKAAVEKALNTQLPSGLNLKVIEATQSEFTVVLPYEPKAAADGELSDADLESVAGGSKAGATHFFNGVGNYVKNHPLTIGSAVAGAAFKPAGVACKIGTLASGQH